eukprot:1928741-Alexandrium_andersonii.AAC.1
MGGSIVPQSARIGEASRPTMHPKDVHFRMGCGQKWHPVSVTPSGQLAPETAVACQHLRYMFQQVRTNTRA